MGSKQAGRRRRRQTLRDLTLMVGAGLLLGGCATNSTAIKPHDPYEDTNRKVFAVNQQLDRYLLEPVAKGYIWLTPGFMRQGVTNFFDNAGYPNVIVNDLLQGKGGQGLRDTGRFLVNSTVGVLGLLDVASPLGLPAHKEDLGQTLAVWGVNSGPFLELPLLGPSYVRETADYPLASFTNVLTYALSSSVALPVTALYVVNKRAELDKAAKIREQAALDGYSFTRAAYMQYRDNLIHDGNPPQEDLYDEEFFLDEPDEAVEGEQRPDAAAAEAEQDAQPAAR